jgi:hypothetical protein
MTIKTIPQMWYFRKKSGRDGSGILLGNGAQRNEPKDTADSPVLGEHMKCGSPAGAITLSLLNEWTPDLLQ